MHIQLVGVVEPKSEDGKIYRLPLALPILVRQLEGTRHTFDVVDTHLNKLSKSALLEFLGRCDAKVYGISAWSEGYKTTKEIARAIRQRHPDAVILVGGLLSRSDDALFDHTEVDVAVTSADGHLILAEILDALDQGRDFAHIRGISWRGPDRSRIVNPPRPIMLKEDYQNSPLPAYEYFEKEIKELVESVSHKGYGRSDREEEPVPAPFPILVSRGCPFACTFCGFMEGQIFHRKLWERAFDEMDFLIKRFGIKNFISQDTNFLLSERDVEEYCNQYTKRGSTFRMVGQYRPTFGTRESLRKLADHGNIVMTFGWESGSQYILDMMRKKSKAKDVLAHARLAAESGQIIYGNFLFGMPGESKATVKETAGFLLELERIFHWQKKDFADRKVPYRMTSGYNYSILVVMPTSPIFDLVIEMGMISDMDAYMSWLDPGEQAGEERMRTHIRHSGTDINLSDFSSREALIHYVRFQLAMVSFKAQFLGGFAAIRNAPRMAQFAGRAIKELWRHSVQVVRDGLTHPESSEYKAKKAEIKRRLLSNEEFRRSA